MANDDAASKQPFAEDEGWIEIGQPAPRVPAPVSAPPIEQAETEERQPFAGKQRTQPWKYSVYTGAAGLVLLLAVYVLRDLFSFQMPWDERIPPGYALLPFPALALIWGLIGAIGKQYRADAARALVGIVLAVLGFVVIFSGVIQAVDTAQPAATTDDRLQMTPQELQEWRSRRLLR
jgi:hypothetical protein